MTIHGSLDNVVQTPQASLVDQYFDQNILLKAHNSDSNKTHIWHMILNSFFYDVQTPQGSLLDQYLVYIKHSNFLQQSLACQSYSM